jgi:hypothetical protein
MRREVGGTAIGFGFDDAACRLALLTAVDEDLADALARNSDNRLQIEIATEFHAFLVLIVPPTQEIKQTSVCRSRKGPVELHRRGDLFEVKSKFREVETPLRAHALRHVT